VAWKPTPICAGTLKGTLWKATLRRPSVRLAPVTVRPRMLPETVLTPVPESVE